MDAEEQGWVDGARRRIAALLGVDINAISVKDTTTERLGFTGRGEGIAAQAIASVRLVDLPSSQPAEPQPWPPAPPQASAAPEGTATTVVLHVWSRPHGLAAQGSGSSTQVAPTLPWTHAVGSDTPAQSLALDASEASRHADCVREQ